VGYKVLPEFSGRGVASKALGALVEAWAIGVMRLRQVSAVSRVVGSRVSILSSRPRRPIVPESEACCARTVSPRCIDIPAPTSAATPLRAPSSAGFWLDLESADAEGMVMGMHYKACIVL
jgi:hypothetical protein